MSSSAAIHLSSPSPLVWRAGQRALARIRQNGLQAADIGLIPGAAGGPKALALTGLDQAIFGQWLPQAPRVRHLLGSSIGAWRFVCAMQADPAKAIANLAARYTAETYAKGVTAVEVGNALHAMLADLFQSAPTDLLAHPDYALTVTSVRAKGLLASEFAFTQLVGVVGAAAINLASRQLYAKVWQRVWFSDPRFGAPAIHADFPTVLAPLVAGNLQQALHATGAIPLVVSGVKDPIHAPPGRYRDGGLIDYHHDLPFHLLDDLVLYPHFYPHIVPRWFDKKLSWRRPEPARLSNVVLVSPSPEWAAGLPFGKIPDRDDFRRFDDAARQKYWRQVSAETARLGDAFLEAVTCDDGLQAIQPF